MKRAIYHRTTLRVNESSQGELLIHKVDRIVNNGEPISDGVQLIYNERKEGIPPEQDIRADRRDIAVNAMSIAAKGRWARRDADIKSREIRPNEKLENEDGKPESTDTTGQEPK